MTLIEVGAFRPRGFNHVGDCFGLDLVGAGLSRGLGRDLRHARKVASMRHLLQNQVWNPIRSASSIRIPSLRVDCADGPDEIRSVSQFDSDLANVDPTESMDSNPDLITAGATKRRGRVRARKVTNPAQRAGD